MVFKKAEQDILDRYFSKSEDPDDSEKLLNSLVSIREAMVSIWEDNIRIIKNYTDHGEKHCERIAKRIEELLQNNKDVKFSYQEIYLLLAGIYLHDIGMQCDIVKYPGVKQLAEETYKAKFDVEFSAKTADGYSLEMQEEIRKNHHLLTAAWIDYIYKMKIYKMKRQNVNRDTKLHKAIEDIPYIFVKDLINICRFHSKLPIREYPLSTGDRYEQKKR